MLPNCERTTEINLNSFLYSLMASKILASFWTFWLGNVYVNTVNNNEEFENIQKKWCGPRLVLTWLQHNVALKHQKYSVRFQYVWKWIFMIIDILTRLHPSSICKKVLPWCVGSLWTWRSRILLNAKNQYPNKAVIHFKW